MLELFVVAAALLGFSAPAIGARCRRVQQPRAGRHSGHAPPEKVSVTFNKNPLGIGAQFSVKDAAAPSGPTAPSRSWTTWLRRSSRPGDRQGPTRWPGAWSARIPIRSRGRSALRRPPRRRGHRRRAFHRPEPPRSPTPTADVPGMGTAQPGTTAAPEPAADASEPFPWSLVIFAAVALGLLVTIGILAKRRLTAGGG